MNAQADDGLDGLRFARVFVWIVYSLVVVAVLILAFAFFFKLTNANPDAGFVDWIYGVSDTLASPFREIWAASESSGGAVFDWSLLFAIVMYIILALAIHAVIAAIDRKMLSVKRQQWETRQQEIDRARAYGGNPPPPDDSPPPPPTAY